MKCTLTLVCVLLLLVDVSVCFNVDAFVELVDGSKFGPSFSKDVNVSVIVFDGEFSSGAVEEPLQDLNALPLLVLPLSSPVRCNCDEGAVKGVEGAGEFEEEDGEESDWLSVLSIDDPFSVIDVDVDTFFGSLVSTSS